MHKSNTDSMAEYLLQREQLCPSTEHSSSEMRTNLLEMTLAFQPVNRCCTSCLYQKAVNKSCGHEVLAS